MPLTASQREVSLRVLGLMSRNGSKLDGPHPVDGSQLEVGVEVRSIKAAVNSTVTPLTASQREVRLRVLGRMSHNGSKLDGPHAVDGSQLEVGVEVRSITPRLFRGES